MTVASVHPVLDVEWQTHAVLPASRNPAAEAEVKRITGGTVPLAVSHVASSDWLCRAIIGTMGLRFSHADPRLLDLVPLVAAYENACRHCYGIQRAVLRIQGYSEAEIEKLEHDLQLAEMRDEWRAALDFARLLARSSPRPARAAVDALVARGFSALEVVEIAALCACWSFGNRVTTLLAVPPEAQLEALPDSLLGKLLRPLIARQMRKRKSLVPAPPAIGAVDVPYAGVVACLDGTHAAALFGDALRSAFASNVLPRRAKVLTFAVVARGLACEACESESRRILGDVGLEADTIGEVLDHLSSPALDPVEAKLVTFARDTVHYRPAQVQERTRVLVGEIGPDRTLEAVGVASLANAVVRLAMLRS